MNSPRDDFRCAIFRDRWLAVKVELVIGRLHVPAIAVLHVAGALKHALSDSDDLMARMGLGERSGLRRNKKLLQEFPLRTPFVQQLGRTGVC